MGDSVVKSSVELIKFLGRRLNHHLNRFKTLWGWVHSTQIMLSRTQVYRGEAHNKLMELWSRTFCRSLFCRSAVLNPCRFRCNQGQCWTFRKSSLVAFCLRLVLIGPAKVSVTVTATLVYSVSSRVSHFQLFYLRSSHPDWTHVISTIWWTLVPVIQF